MNSENIATQTGQITNQMDAGAAFMDIPAKAHWYSLVLDLICPWILEPGWIYHFYLYPFVTCMGEHVPITMPKVFKTRVMVNYCKNLNDLMYFNVLINALLVT